MAKILILAQSGFGKSTSIGKNEALGIKGLNPKETFIISATKKGLPFPGWKSQYTMAVLPPEKGNYFISNNGYEIAKIISWLGENRKEIKNIIFDDSNYIMQDYYMANSLKGGFDTFKQIGDFMGKIFNAIESLPSETNVVMMAHYEEFKDSSSDTLSYRYKTVGSMVNFVPLFI